MMLPESFTSKNITKGLDLLRQMTSLRTIGISHVTAWPAAEFWKEYDAGKYQGTYEP